MDEPETTCIACSGVAVARVQDGAFRKPVCVTHRRIYSERGYLIDTPPWWCGVCILWHPRGMGTSSAEAHAEWERRITAPPEETV